MLGGLVGRVWQCCCFSDLGFGEVEGGGGYEWKLYAGIGVSRVGWSKGCCNVVVFLALVRSRDGGYGWNYKPELGFAGFAGFAGWVGGFVFGLRGWSWALETSLQ